MREKLNEQSNYNGSTTRQIVRTQRMLGAFQDRSRSHKYHICLWFEFSGKAADMQIVK